MNNDLRQGQDHQAATVLPPVVYLVRKEEDGRKVDLVDLVRAFWARRLLICAITFCFIAAGVAWALLSTPIFRVDVTLAPAQSARTSMLSGRLGGLANLAGINVDSGSESTQAIAILQSRAFVESFIVDTELLPVLFPDRWDPTRKTWKNSDPAEQPNLWNGVTYFRDNVISVEPDQLTGLVTLSVEWTEAETAAAWAQQLVNRVNDQLRTRDLEYSESKLKYLNNELERASLLEVRTAIAAVIQDQVQTIALAKGEVEYAFRVLDPPRVPMERVRPNRPLIVILAAMAGGLISICVVTVLFLFNRPSQGLE